MPSRDAIPRAGYAPLHVRPARRRSSVSRSCTHRHDHAVERPTRAILAKKRRNSAHPTLSDVASESCVVYRPAVSRNTASSVNHQSQLRVPLTRNAPLLTRCSSGNLRPELRALSSFRIRGADDTYQGRSQAVAGTPPLLQRTDGLVEGPRSLTTRQAFSPSACGCAAPQPRSAIDRCAARLHAFPIAQQHRCR
jgi:hypothetical protein